MRRPVRGGFGHYGTGTEIPVQSLYETKWCRIGKGLADGSAVCKHVGEWRVF